MKNRDSKGRFVKGNRWRWTSTHQPNKNSVDAFSTPGVVHHKSKLEDIKLKEAHRFVDSL